MICLLLKTYKCGTNCNAKVTFFIVVLSGRGRMRGRRVPCQHDGDCWTAAEALLSPGILPCLPPGNDQGPVAVGSWPTTAKDCCQLPVWQSTIFLLIGTRSQPKLSPVSNQCSSGSVANSVRVVLVRARGKGSRPCCENCWDGGFFSGSSSINWRCFSDSRHNGKTKSGLDKHLATCYRAK